MSILWVLLVPTLYAAANLADKFQLDGDGEDSTPGALMALGGFFSFFAAVLIGIVLLINQSGLGGWKTFLPLIANESLYVFGIYLYMIALKDEETSRVLPWFQSIPMFGLLGSFLVLGETLSGFAMLAIFALMAGGFLLSFRDGKPRWKVIILMIIASGILATNDVIFARFGREIDDTGAFFTSLCGKTIWSGLFLVSAKARRGFITGIKTKLRVQSASEITCIVADTGLSLAILHFKVTVVQAICCIQPMVILIGAYLLTRFFPKVLREEIEGLTIAQKIIGILLTIVGGFILVL